MKPPRTAREKIEALADLIDVDEDSELEGVLLSKEEIERRLAAAGPEVLALAAQGRAEHEAAVAELAALEANTGVKPPPQATAREKIHRLVDFLEEDDAPDAPDAMEYEGVLLPLEEVKRRMAEAGLDVAEEARKARLAHEEAVAELHALEGAKDEPVAAPPPALALTPAPKKVERSNVISLGSVRARWAIACAAAASFAALIATEGATMVAWVEGGPHGGLENRTARDRFSWALEQRKNAAKSASEGDWVRCLELLDRAKEVDPEGEQASPEVKALRVEAEGKLGRGEGGE